MYGTRFGTSVLYDYNRLIINTDGSSTCSDSGNSDDSNSSSSGDMMIRALQKTSKKIHGFSGSDGSSVGVIINPNALPLYRTDNPITGGAGKRKRSTDVGSGSGGSGVSSSSSGGEIGSGVGAKKPNNDHVTGKWCVM